MNKLHDDQCKDEVRESRTGEGCYILNAVSDWPTMGASQYSGLPTDSNHAQPDAAVAQMHVASQLSSGELHSAQRVWGASAQEDMRIRCFRI